MKIFTNDNNTATLKLLIAANFAGKKIELVKASFSDQIFSGPRQLPFLQHGELTFFSSNTALQYLMPPQDSVRDQCIQLLEWEASRLSPTVASVLTSKSVAADLKQTFQSLLQHIDSILKDSKYLWGAELSSVDISIWSTVYPLYYSKSHKQYFDTFNDLSRWMDEIHSNAVVQDAIKLWGGSPDAPVGVTSSLGIPQLSNLIFTTSSPDEQSVEGPTPDEIESAKENWIDGFKKLPVLAKQEKVILPVKNRKNVLITSALPYVNNVPHLGNIIGCVLSADIFARYCRLCNYNTLFICGTDEYGTATETKALEEGVTPKQICDKYFDIHNSVYRWFNIGFDYFGRTSTPQQTEIAQKMFLKLKENGFINSQSVDQLLCEKCDRFLADRFVEGTCPHPGCLYENARGDQCDKCGKLINAIELIDPRCKVCTHKPTVRPSIQLFIELPQLEPSLRTWISSTESGWSAPARAVTRSWLKEPLRPRAVTRDMKWGVPVPVEGYTSKVFYVWFDAPIGYLSITQNATKQYEKWWKPNNDTKVTLYQFMAKDNVPFHTIMFPATLLGINEGHILVNHLFATEYLNYEEGKFSKSRGVGVFGTDAQETGIPSDVWRFYLASIRPETSDSSFSWIELGTRNNSELLNNLGNFCHRSLSFCANSFKSSVPDVQPTQTEYELIALVNRELKAYVVEMEKGRLRSALRRVLAVSKLGNQHMQAQQPWLLLKGTQHDIIRGATTIGISCQLVALLAVLIAPYMPNTSRSLCTQLNLPQDRLAINYQNPSFVQYLQPGHVIGKPEPLFSKIETELLDKLKAKYSGTQSDRAKQNGECPSVAELEAAITEQGNKLRDLKIKTKDKSVLQPEIDKLLALKKQLAAAQTTQNETAQEDSVASLEKTIAEQGEKVRKLKASTKDKTVWQPEVNVLLDLKKKLAAAQAKASTQNSAASESVASLEKAIAEQGDKVRKLKASTKDKSVWQPEVNVLLNLKKKLSELQEAK